MFGIKAISAQNGWEYALVGVCIVFSGLIILASVLSQLHKLLRLWENRSSLWQGLKSRWEKDPPLEKHETPQIEPLSDLLESRQHYKMLVERIGDPFALPKLLRLAERHGLQRPHATINELLLAGIIQPHKNGYFTWKKMTRVSSRR